MSSVSNSMLINGFFSLRVKLDKNAFGSILDSPLLSLLYIMKNLSNPYLVPGAIVHLWDSWLLRSCQSKRLQWNISLSFRSQFPSIPLIHCQLPARRSF